MEYMYVVYDKDAMVDECLNTSAYAYGLKRRCDQLIDIAKQKKRPMAQQMCKAKEEAYGPTNVQMKQMIKLARKCKCKCSHGKCSHGNPGQCLFNLVTTK